MNKSKLRAICHKIALDTGLSFNSIMVYYFLESILKKLSSSDYSKNIVFKGGFILSNIVGIESRSTVDIDFMLKNQNLSEENIYKILFESLRTEEHEDISYEIINAESIKEKDKYGGFRFKILCKLENIKQIVPLDIATGDIITPNPVDYKYKSLFSEDYISIKAYPIETMIAEKIETIYSRGFLNSRSKDYYDLYVIYKLKKREVNFEILEKACIRTFTYRKTEFDIDKIIYLMEDLKSNESFLKRWKSYSKKNIYVKDIKFEEVLDNGINIIKQLKN